MRLYVFYPMGSDLSQAETEYQRHWGPKLVRDEFDWSLILNPRGRVVLVAGLGDEVDLGGLGLTWEKQRTLEARIKQSLRVKAELEDRGSL